MLSLKFGKTLALFFDKDIVKSDYYYVEELDFITRLIVLIAVFLFRCMYDKYGIFLKIFKFHKYSKSLFNIWKLKQALTIKLAANNA